MDTAKIIWRDNQPFSAQFEDVYYSSDDGLAETDYVFLQGNQLAKRWKQADLRQFTIVETGFGSGLNFLCAAKLWLTCAPKDAMLHFISIEKYPLSLADMTESCRMWPTLNALSSDFLTLYQALISQNASTEKNGFLGKNNIHLSLLIGDVSHCLKMINKSTDAWFLDGFAPAKNPDMWSQQLFNKMASLANPHTTFSTFTASGMVRRGLTEAGFQVTKQVGFGKKREMLTGMFPPQKAA
jgi:tRNA U34 5-methylaminomethyl-2-thiouridine-forming methyltransferase MnmC